MEGWEDILHDGEEILWQGRPDHGVRLKGTNPAQALFHVFFIGFAIYWTVQATSISRSFSDGFARIFPLFGLIFVGVGAYNLFGKFFWQAYVRRHTFYTLTDQRAFIATDTPIGAKTLSDYPIGPSTEIDWSGDSVYFARQRRRTSKGGSYTVKTGFEFLGTQVPEVQRALKTARRVKAAPQ
ncbi:aspartate carbamoyltransferase catalytic subunit [Alphaproteobacteria bacterium KMM 3653]|uniref:Aspartate carbamoyltransferase catalytic subunit n=1 Tax=Harenicola maris TaxID=2841044 RepID=A0AAP2G873_9RHOB|nr:aspartate carbamoyltransferase catalytic subunit [Harenicola maris]